MSQSLTIIFGLVHEELGDVKQPEDCHERALHICLKTFGPEDVKVADTYKNLGDVHIHQGQIQEAKKYFNLALEIYDKNFDAEDEKVRVVQDALARLHQERERTHGPGPVRDKRKCSLF